MKDDASCVEIAATANSLFLSSFEKWVAASIACNQKGVSTEQRIRTIAESYDRAIKGNIEYHTQMASLESEEGNKDSATLHLAMAQAYRALVLN